MEKQRSYAALRWRLLFSSTVNDADTHKYHGWFVVKTKQGRIYYKVC